MLKYILKRLFYAVFVLFGAATLVFFLARLTGDPISIMLPPDASQEQVDQMTAFFGLDKPLLEQYWIYLGNLLRLDFGTSLRYFQPVFGLIMERIPATLQLAGAAMLFALIIAIPAGIIAAPVGFVHVQESKHMVKPFVSIPKLIIEGRKGGSNLAATLVNAILCYNDAKQLKPGRDV